MLPEYKIIYSKRRTIGIIIRPDKRVEVRAPYGLSRGKIEKFVLEKEKWIRKHTEKSSESTRLNEKWKYHDGEEYLFLGQKLSLKINNSLFPSVEKREDILEVYTDGREGRIKMLIERWYMEKSQEITSARMKVLLDRYKEYQFEPKHLVVRSLKSRWGSCTSKGKITINSELIKLDERYIDYVITHELCHLKYHNHGKEYYQLLETLVPDYKLIRKELRKYSLS